ncbi:electron transfer flavoprotein subunit beta/FixA family protein [Arthrobacter sp. FW305-BF8]|uniref:electron transfer flavoprotein subunit beta/FixA family protein n=1 Tax=Arthrobacter sp. FW305-BF8 TaxID=2879617 RepID=UPI001F34AECE|nr:electron transfer flavoprotein subunit beta/FixA family protein [Arthrobacter sp. FW305-BF8]UKA55206.1 electron transfer flavoprotein subunit beta/FixA family protein [Arthrobacter sp. FW305-BF8]
MKIVVLVKEVPDTYGDPRLSLETGLTERNPDEAVFDEIGERALEVALTYCDRNPDTGVVALSMGPATSGRTLRKCLATGATSAVHVVDDALVGADLGLTAQVLAAALKREGFDLVLAGEASTDGSAGMIPAMLAELLDVPNATALSSVEIDGDRVSGDRASDGGRMRVSAQLPAIVSVTEALPAARVSTLKGIRSAKKKPLEILSLADLGVDADDPGASRSILIAVAQRKAREAGVKIVDEGDGGERIAEFLVQKGLA